ncbi:MAG TPA: hypothetical protein VK943_06180 [Arenibaculum sp.]|nr:hypothetical protein [Arenibaculum sp.]
MDAVPRCARRLHDLSGDLSGDLTGGHRERGENESRLTARPARP